jgi:rare lipoprotein A (peptidoglycan hydrolase)
MNNTNLEYQQFLRGLPESIKAEKNRRLTRFAIVIFCLAIPVGFMAGRVTKPIIKETIIKEIIVTPTPSPTSTPTPTKSSPRGENKKGSSMIFPTKQDTNLLEGKASYYSEEGCLGCDENLIMANGQKLDDTKLTLALTPEAVKQHKLLNDLVTVINTSTNQKVIAKVTDTGGFSKYNRVADLSVATRNAIGCTGLCDVRIIIE